MKKFLYTAALAATCLFTSCLEGDDGQRSGSGYFTITGNKTLGYTLYMDGGGVIIPSASSVAKFDNFGKTERAYLVYTYYESNLSEDANTINGADLVGGEAYLPQKPLIEEEATALNILAEDSLFNVNKVTGLWAYRGFINVIYNGNYALNEKGTAIITPTSNLVYTVNPDKPNEVDLQLCYNQHHSKQINHYSNYTFTDCYYLSPLANLIPGNDSVLVNVSVRGLKDPLKIKISRKDFTKEF